MANNQPVRALNLDLPQQQSFIRFYKSLPTKAASTVRFFKHVDFYSVHEEDASFAAEEVNNIIKYMGAEPKLSYLCLNQNNFEKFVRDLLLVKQYRVEVYASNSTTKNKDWTLEYKGSPGNLEQFETLLFENADVINSVVMGVKLAKQNALGVASVDSSECTFFVTEITDNEFFTELEALVAQISPKECVIPAGASPELITLKKVLERNNVMVIQAKKTDYDTSDMQQHLNHLLYFKPDAPRNAAIIPEVDKLEAMSALQAVMKYLDLIADPQNANQFRISSQTVGKYMRLGNAALHALDVLNKPGSVARSKYDTVFGILNACATKQGKRLLERWLKQPIKDIKILSERLDVVEALVNGSEVRNLVSCGLNKCSDLLLLAKRLCSKKATLQDCYKVYQVVSSVPGLLSILRDLNAPSVNDLLVEPTANNLNLMENYQAMIEKTIDMDLIDRGEFFIKACYNANLLELSERKLAIEQQMKKEFRKVGDDLGFECGKNIKLECTNQHGYFFRVTLKEESAMRKNKNYEIIDAIKGGVRFLNNKLKQLNEDYLEINREYEAEQKVVVEEVFHIAAEYSDVLRSLNMNIAMVDVLVAFAISSTNAPIRYVRPKLLPMGTGVLKLKKARHPCLERQNGTTVVPNDVNFNSSDKTLYIITGPNMGGKSTYMRTVGLSVLLAHIGCFVPCESAEISIVDSILARLGADDCELKGMSTFMMEMVDTNTIIRGATSNSLVIIDELGRGTSTYDGCGIAYAIAEHLAKDVQAFTLFATHYHEITQLGEQLENVGNLNVMAVITEKTITPLYQVVEGVSDKSYGIHCARLANFPEDVIHDAQQHQAELEDADGMKYIKDLDAASKRKIIQEGDALLAVFREKLKQIDLNCTDDEMKAEVESVRNDLLSHNNLFVKGLLCE